MRKRSSDLLSEGVVGRNAVISAALHVECGQIESPVLARVLEQVVGHFLRHGSVHGLRDLILRHAISTATLEIHFSTGQ